MDFGDREFCKLVAKAIGGELRQAREVNDWSRAQFVERLPSGIGDRTILSYEHGTRDLTLLRYLELCQGLGVEAPYLLGRALQQAQILLENLSLAVDLRALLADNRPKFRPMVQWARNSLNRNTGGVAEVVPASVIELADFLGCAHDELRVYLAGFVPDFDYAPRKNGADN